MIELKTIFFKELDAKTKVLEQDVLNGTLGLLEYKVVCKSVSLLKDVRELFEEIYDKLYRNEDDADFNE